MLQLVLSHSPVIQNVSHVGGCLCKLFRFQIHQWSIHIGILYYYNGDWVSRGTDVLDVGFSGVSLCDKCRPTFFDAGLLLGVWFIFTLLLETLMWIWSILLMCWGTMFTIFDISASCPLSSAYSLYLNGSDVLCWNKC